MIFNHYSKDFELKTKQNKSISVRVVILYNTPLLFKPLCSQLTIENIWANHWSVLSHMAFFRQ